MKWLSGKDMTSPRPCTLSIKMTPEENLRAHALADAVDDSVGRYLRRLIAREYERLFGDAPPPAVKTRMGRPRKRAPEDVAEYQADVRALKTELAETKKAKSTRS
jgi:hypothetical protein